MIYYQNHDRKMTGKGGQPARIPLVRNTCITHNIESQVLYRINS